VATFEGVLLLPEFEGEKFEEQPQEDSLKYFGYCRLPTAMRLVCGLKVVFDLLPLLG